MTLLYTSLLSFVGQPLAGHAVPTLLAGLRFLSAQGRPIPARWALVLLVLAGSGSGVWAQCFLAPTNYGTGTGTSAQSVAVEDFNGDGKPDLAVAIPGLNTVLVLLNTGNGVFGPPTSYGVGGFPGSLAVGDFNADGKPDLATANLGSSNVSVLLNTGSGSFSLANYTLGANANPRSVAVGDINGDGRLDLAVASAIGSSYHIAVLVNMGNGVFGFPFNHTPGSLPQSVAVGDVNGDGKPDLATANYGSNNVSVLLSMGNGAFGPATNYPAGSSPYSIAIGDFNGDGKPDLATANIASNNVSVLLNTGSGVFGQAMNYPVGENTRSVAVGDFNRDGKADLAVASSGSRTVSVLLSTGSGSFGQPTNYTVGIAYSVAVGDFNADGNSDLAVGNSNSSNVSVLLNTFLSLATQPASGSAICVGGSVTTSVSVSTLGTSSYQWYKDGSPVTSQTAATLSLPSVTTANAGSYSVVVSGGCNSVTSTAFSLTVNSLPIPSLVASGTLTCASPSVTLTAGTGTSYTFSAGATQTGGNIANTATVSVPDTYTVRVANAAGCTATTTSTVQSNTAPPTATLLPTSVPCASPSLTLTAGGGSSYTLTGGIGSLTSTSGQFMVSQGGTYTVTAINASNGCTATAIATVVNSSSQTVGITAQPPASSLVCEGTGLSLPVGVTGTVATYQWYKDGSIVSGQPTATLSLSSVTSADAGSYLLVVTGCNSVTSATFTLLVSPFPTPGLFISTGTIPFVAQATGGVLYERLKFIDRINGYQIRQSEQNATGYFVIDGSGPFSITVVGPNGCRAVVSGVAP